MKKWWTILLVLGFAWSGAVLAGEVDVVTSFTVLADMVRQVGGHHVQVKSLVGPNGDPHVYEPTPQDAEVLAKARLVVINGLGLEGWMTRLISASGYRGKVAVASRGIPPRRMREEDAIDPHAWNSAANGAVYASNITNALMEVDPVHAMDYRERGAQYEHRLRDLDAWARQAVARLAPARRRVITSHDAFGYLGAAYGIEFLAPVGVSTESESSAAHVAELIDQIKREQVKVVFLENSNDPRLAEQLASTAGAQLGGTLYAEALSPAGGPAPTYEEMFRYNVNQLVRAMASK